MARLNLSEEVTMRPATLDELIPEYANNKSNLDHYEKVCKLQNADIKKQMEELDEVEHTAGGYTVKRIVSERESMNEERLLEMLKKHNVPDVIKTKEYVDMDALEKYLYNTELSDEMAADLNSCREIKEVVQIRLGKEKKKKEE
jgi:hypothetical protein